MGIVEAKTSGKCSKCGDDFYPGDKIGVEKGKPPLCGKCAPKPAPGAKPPYRSGWTPRPTAPAVPAKNQWDTYAELVLTQILKGHPDQFPGPQAAAALAADYADKMMAARAKRGIK